MISIHIEDRDGTKRTLEIEENPSGSLMEILTAENFDVPAICGGIAGCGTCHIAILKGGETLESPEEDEVFMLDSLSNYTPQSRLSCQLPLTRSLDGAEIKVLGDGD
ncbi:MAG: 2Fe-2S iron-sulfur cluster-binding protein [Bacteroidia bacterium]